MHTLAQLCVRRPVFATMLILALVVVGIFCYFSLGVDLFPKVDIPTVIVTIVNPGASPEEIETEISKKVEDAVNTISQVDELRSTSSEGQSLVTIQFELSKNGDVAAQEVQNKVNLIVNKLPETAKQPIVQKFDPDATPILQIAVSANRSLRDVTLIADKQIKQKLENARGVGQIYHRRRRPPGDSRRYSANYQIAQGPGWVVLVNEMAHDARVIPLDGRPHVPQEVRQWMGDARGHWEGNTLVVETTNFTDKTAFRGSSDKMRLVERFTRTGPDTLMYEFTVDDPATFGKPWTAEDSDHASRRRDVRIRLPRRQLRHDGCSVRRARCGRG